MLNINKTQLDEMIEKIAYNHNTDCNSAIIRNDHNVYMCYSLDTSCGGISDRPKHIFYGYYDGNAHDVIRYLYEKFSRRVGWNSVGGGYMIIAPKIRVVPKFDDELNN